jgi:hypothetical protein
MKTSELTGPALDWAVAKITNPEWWTDGYMDGDPRAALEMDDGSCYAPSSDWAQGGPIIERERLHLIPQVGCSEELAWHCTTLIPDVGSGDFANGPTPLIAAMRCYVASKLGDTVEIPPELEN